MPEELIGLTWDEFLNLPYETRNTSLIDGEVVVNSPNAQHELVVRNLILAFMDWIHAGTGRGQVSTQQPVKVNDRRGYQPDFLWYPQEHVGPAGEPLRFTGPPGLIVEVYSPSTRRKDFIRKRVDYERIGIPEAWFVDPEDRQFFALVCQRPEPDGPYKDVELHEDDRLTSLLLPGFDVEVGALFER